MNTLDEPVSETIVRISLSLDLSSSTHHLSPKAQAHSLSFPPISQQQLRDLKSIYAKLLQVLYPPRAGSSGSGSELLKEWDLWGPLVICLALAIVLSLDVSFRPSSSLLYAFVFRAKS